MTRKLLDNVGSERHSEIERIFDRLWPLFRSITGEGVRQTHDILSELLPLERIEVPSGTKVLDWTVPKEWKVREAYILEPGGSKILDVSANNLHLMGYSIPFSGVLPLEELEKHLYSLPNNPTAIPYMTSYYTPRWGFCISHEQRMSLPPGNYTVVVDTEMFDGSMTMSELLLKGDSDQEVLFSTYTCHPSLANNELSGPLTAAFLYRRLAMLPYRRFSYRFLFIPETIGAIAYLAQKGDELKEKLIAGYVLTCTGMDSIFTYKRSRIGNSLADRAAEHVLRETAPDNHEVRDFFPSGSDERQYCSQGFNLPVGSIVRGMYGKYPEYHTSLDNKSIISFKAIQEVISTYVNIVSVIENNRRYTARILKGEPHLSSHGVFPTPTQLLGIQWILGFSDGQNDLIEIARMSGLKFDLLVQCANMCVEAGLIDPVTDTARLVA